MFNGVLVVTFHIHNGVNLKLKLSQQTYKGASTKRVRFRFSFNVSVTKIILRTQCKSRLIDRF